jgi:hypothetical protein
MTPHWLLETDTFLEGNPQRLFDLLRARNLPVKWVKYVPFEGTVFDQFPPDACVIVYGSLNLANHVARLRPWIPGVWTDLHTLRASTYLAHWGRFSVQRDYTLYPLGEIQRLLPQLLARFGDDGRIFIRPNENDKSFTGTVVNHAKFEEWLDINTRCYDLDPTMLVLVSRPQNIRSEHRFIVADRQVITGSKYRRGPTLLDGADAAGFDIAARDFAQQVVSCAAWQPLRFYSLDVAELPDGHALLEFGSANSCGLYGCDLQTFLDHASRIALDDWQKTREHKPPA